MRLDILYLGENKLTTIPESLCSIYDNLSSINIGKLASMNYSDLGTKDYDSISSLCISRVS